MLGAHPAAPYPGPVIPPPRRTRLPSAAAAAAVAGALLALATACGPDEGRTALAIESTRWDGPGRVVVTFECADLRSLEVAPTGGPDGEPLVTAWGRPRVGRCTTEATVTVGPDVDRLTDAATGTVVDLPDRP